MIGNFALNKLEYDKIQGQLASLCAFEGGRRLAWKIKPVADLDWIERGFSQNEEAIDILRGAENNFFTGLGYPEQILAKVKIGGILNPAELLEVYHLLLASRRAARALHKPDTPYLYEIARDLYSSREMERQISDIVDEEGHIKDTASLELKRIRGQISGLRIRIREYLQNFIRSTHNQKLLQDLLVTEREGRYVLPVKQEHRYEVKGLIHDESASGATVFIEPMQVVEQNNKIRQLQLEEKREIERLLREISGIIHVEIQPLMNNLSILSELDLILARGKLALKQNAYRPQINDRGYIQLGNARHPLLGEGAVPVDIELGRHFDVLVITGPNTGGKTVVLKTVGLLCCMAMSALYVPARERSELSIFHSVFVDIGDEQSIEQSLSTFSSHMVNIIDIMRQAGPESLVLLDELGAGTDPVEGSALARAILEEFIRSRARVLVTTHQSELKTFAYQTQRVENACVEFDPVTLQPSYKLTIGMPGQSNAFEIAARLGLPQATVDRARETVPEQALELNTMLQKLKETRFHYERLLRDVETMRRQLVEERTLVEQQRDELYREKNEIVRQARAEAKKYIQSIKKEADEAIADLKVLLSEKEKQPKWHEVTMKRQRIKKLGQDDEPPEEFSDHHEAILPGDYVHITHIKKKGHVLNVSESSGEATVQVGVLKLNVKQKNLLKIEAPGEVKEHARRQTFLQKVQNLSPEIDLRGKRAEDALLDLDKYLEDAHLAGLESVRIIHGKGSGALRAAVREYFQSHGYIDEFRDGLREEGGHGVTIARLK